MTADSARSWKIGSLQLSNPLLLAPLSGISDLPFRLLAKEQGCALVCTEMVSAEGLMRNRKKSEKLLQTCPEERPLAVQIFGARPETMADAARIVEEVGADVLDINMGCPARKVVKGGSGAALLMDLKRAKEIIQSVRKAVSLPLTVKVRSGWDEKNQNVLEVSKMAEDCGVNALTVHGRTRNQGYGVKADWRIIARAKEYLRIPVIGNGDLTSPQAVVAFLSETGCAGAMIGRGALGNPWIFQQALAMLRGETFHIPSLSDKEVIILRHLNMVVERYGETQGLKEFRKHIIWYTRGLRDNAYFRSRLPHWKTASEVSGQIREYFQKMNHPLLFS
ncbi:MAG: tRNA dihydrouridine synthase DusB [Pseudomonadota bacterium]